MDSSLRWFDDSLAVPASLSQLARVPDGARSKPIISFSTACLGVVEIINREIEIIAERKSKALTEDVSIIGDPIPLQYRHPYRGSLGASH